MGNGQGNPTGFQTSGGHWWMISPIATTTRQMHLMRAFGLPPIMLPAYIGKLQVQSIRICHFLLNELQTKAPLRRFPHADGSEWKYRV